MKKNTLKKYAVLLLLFFIASGFLFSQDSFSQLREPSLADRGIAEKEFRLGVLSYYRGAYNEAIIQFEKALAFLPQEYLILDWLAKSYYKSGIENAALQTWTLARDAGYGGMLLENTIEIVKERRSYDKSKSLLQTYSESGVYPGNDERTLFFSNPVSIKPLNDGTSWLVAYGSNEIVRLDINGQILQRFRGPLNGFDRPMDILVLDNGNLVVSEYSGDRLSLLDAKGSYIKSFGSKGRGEGQLLGPQYLAQDSQKNIYVSDFGNARISVFTQDGDFLFYFGLKSKHFSGLEAPTGIAVHEDRVYVCDAVYGSIIIFDTSGNYISHLTEKHVFENPEALWYWNEHFILADTRSIKAVSLKNGAVETLGNTGKTPGRLTSAAMDVNGNLIASDYILNEINLLSTMEDLIGGLFVQVERVHAESFPKVRVEVKVENRKGDPIVGLKEVNFLFTENKRPVSDLTLVGATDNNTVADISLLIDRSLSMKAYEKDIERAVREIASSMDGGRIRIVSLGSSPVTEIQTSPENLRNFSINLLKTPYVNTIALDTGIRLAANDLINAERKRAIVLLSDTERKTGAFRNYGLTELSSYLNTNAIPFCAVSLNQGSLSPEIDYLVSNTKGLASYLYRPEGISSLYKEILSIPKGTYQFTFFSSLPTHFGQSFLPLEVETYLFNKSSRAETGYFAPLE